MRDFVHRAQPPSDGRDRGGAGHLDNCGVGVGTYPPHMEVGNPCVSGRFDQLANLILHMLVCSVQKNGRRVAHQGPRPARHHGSADDAHDGIHPHPAEITAAQQRGDGKNRGQRVRNDVNVSGPQIIIPPLGVAMVMVVIMMVPVRMTAAQEQGACNIHRQADERNPGRSPERDLDRLE